jgi:hypothetical protein
MGAAISYPPRDKKRTRVEQAFVDVGDQLVEIRRELMDTAPRVVESVVDDWVVEQTRRCIHAMRGSLESKRQHATNYVAGFDGERPEDRKARHQAFFAAVDPKVLAEELDSKELALAVWATYKHTFAELCRKSSYGRLLGRYQLPEKVIDALVAEALGSVSEARAALEAHDKQYRANAEYLAALAAGAGDLTEEVEKSMRAAHRTFERVCSEIVSVRRGIEKNLRLVFMTIYVGGVVRFARDLTTMGRELFVLDFEKAHVRVELRAKEKAAFYEWCASAREELDDLEANGRWAELAAVATRALEFVTADPARRNELSDEESTSYAVLFARARCRALSRAADTAWSRGDVVVAATLYRALLEGTNLAWESSTGKTPEEESIAVAGMRLALACSSKKGRRVPNAESILSTLVIHVQQALVRLASDASEHRVAGEAIDPHTLRCARVLAAYCAKEQIPIVPPSGLPGALQNKVETLGWNHDAVASFMGEIGGWSKRVGGSLVRDSKLLLWLRSTVNERRRRRILKGLKITTTVVALASAAFWIKGMWPGWKEQYMPTRIEGKLTPPKLVEPGPNWETLFTNLTPLEHVEFAEAYWSQASKQKVLSREQLEALEKHLRAVPPGTQAAKRADRLRQELEERYLAARNDFANETRFAYMGGRYSVRAAGVDKRQFRVSSTRCDESKPKQIFEEFGAELRRLGFEEIQCNLWGKADTWTHTL